MSSNTTFSTCEKHCKRGGQNTIIFFSLFFCGNVRIQGFDKKAKLKSLFLSVFASNFLVGGCVGSVPSVCSVVQMFFLVEG